MTLETTKWDAADYLDSPEMIAAYIDAALEDGDPALIAAALENVARAKGMSKAAKEALHKALSADGAPRLTTFLGVIKSLGLQITVRPASTLG
jgi:probable addiction module antidote protein